jgi:hypothetical protein
LGLGVIWFIFHDAKIVTQVRDHSTKYMIFYKKLTKSILMNNSWFATELGKESERDRGREGKKKGRRERDTEKERERDILHLFAIKSNIAYIHCVLQSIREGRSDRIFIHCIHGVSRLSSIA